MKKQMELIAFYLPKPFTRGDIEEALGVTFKKGIEATYYTEVDKALLTYTQFNVLTMINWPKVKIIETLEMLGIEEAENFQEGGIFQDYPIHIDSDLPVNFTVDNDKITLKEYSRISLIIIAHVISQSVALELYEQKLFDYYERSRHLVDTSDTYSIFKRTRLARFAKQLVLIRHDMLIDLLLLDKPNILWDNEDAERLYNSLAYSLDLKDRFEIVEYKLNSIKDDIVMVMDLTNHNHSSFLEWIIIVLIAVEIGMGVMEWFGPVLGHK
jgi:uncharacterized Rmd1/YagE family protein